MPSKQFDHLPLIVKTFAFRDGVGLFLAFLYCDIKKPETAING